MPDGRNYLWELIQKWLDAQPFHVSQRQLAKKVGVSPTMLTYWKAGQGSPGPEALNLIAEITNIPKRRLLRALLLDLGYVASEAEDEALWGDPPPSEGQSQIA